MKLGLEVADLKSSNRFFCFIGRPKLRQLVSTIVDIAIFLKRLDIVQVKPVVFNRFREFQWQLL